MQMKPMESAACTATVNVSCSPLYFHRPTNGRSIGAGNIHQLCMQRHTFNSTLSPPSSSADEPYISSSTLPPYWSFTLAQNFLDSSRTGDLDYAKKCAKAVGVDWEESGVAKCVGDAGAEDAMSGGKEGQALLLESVERLVDLDVTYVSFPLVRVLE
jgi:hypothetical protein